MFEELSDFCSRPPLYSRTTATELWTRPALARHMLEFHLDPNTQLSSRPEAQIDHIVHWLDQQLILRGKRLCDLGCGPGLYANRFAGLGAVVCGLDVSAGSLEYARHLARQSGHEIRYTLANYCEDVLPTGFDIVTLIYYDYAALVPEQRSRLLGRIRTMLEPGGRLVLDVPSAGAFSAVREGINIEAGLMGGFWSDEDYVGLEGVWRYEEQRVSLSRYLIIERSQAFEIYNWMQYFTADSIAGELETGGFQVEQISDSLAGTALEGDPETLGVIATRA